MDYEIILATYEYVDQLTSSDEYQKIKEIEKRIFSELKSVVDPFLEAKKKFLVAQEYGPHYPEYNKYAKELSIAKEKLYNEDMVKEYFRNVKIIQGKLNELKDEIKETIGM